MMKMLIQLDEERVLSDEKYALEDMWRVIDNKFNKYQCNKEVLKNGAVMYSGNPEFDYFTCMGLAYLSLKKQKWFANYCEKWILYDNEDDETLPFQDIDLLKKEKDKNPLFATDK